MFSIQEICSKFAPQIKNVRDSMDRTTTFHPDIASVYTDVGLADAQGIRETLNAIPYSKLKEHLSRDTTIGDYLVADKIHDDIVSYSKTADLCPLISAQMVNGWEGGDLIVNVAQDGPEGYTAWEFATNALAGTATVTTAAKATLTPIGFAVNPRIGEDLVEDTSFNGDLIQWHLKKAAQAIGEKATDMAVTVLKAAADGVGTLNSGNAGADTTTWANLETALAANVDDRFPSNTVLINPEAWEDSVRDGVGEEVAGGAAGDFWRPYAYGVSIPPVAEGFDWKIGNLDFKQVVMPCNHAVADTTSMTNCVTVAFDRNNSLLTGRKRWMKIENYVEPFKDLAGCVISCRQDSVSLYNDSVFTLSET